MLPGKTVCSSWRSIVSLASIVERDTAVLVLVDMQLKLAAVMPRRAEVLAASQMLARSATALGIPIIVTRQYPDGLGDTM